MKIYPNAIIASIVTEFNQPATEVVHHVALNFNVNMLSQVFMIRYAKRNGDLPSEKARLPYPNHFYKIE